MRFILLQAYGGVESDTEPMSRWTPDEIRAHIQFQHDLNRELQELGELVDAQGLAAPELALLAAVEEPLAGHHRLHATRAHLLEMAGDAQAALPEYEAAAARTTSLPEQRYLTMRAAALSDRRASGPAGR